MTNRTIINILKTTRIRLTKFKDKWFDAESDDELINDMIDELEKVFDEEE